MEGTWFLAALWLGLALLATLIAIWLRISTALSEIVVGTVAQLVIGASMGLVALGSKAPWIGFLAGTGSIVLTFLAGAELDPATFRAKWREATWIGLVGFFAPFLGCTALAYYVLGWTARSSWLAGVPRPGGRGAREDVLDELRRREVVRHGSGRGGGDERKAGSEEAQRPHGESSG